MDQACVDAFLDDGWGLIGQLHRWLSGWPHSAYDRVELVDLIGQLQSLWSMEDDLELSRLSRTTLALEQLLERFCSRTLEFDAELLADLTAATQVFQDLLLGFEATREEPAFSGLELIVKLERHVRRPHRSDIFHTNTEAGKASTPSVTERSSVAAVSSSQLTADASAATAPISIEPTIQPSVIAMLEQFVTKLDDTCHRLHARMLRDETPYITTTSRLEHLSQVTRDLVEQIARAAQGSGPFVPGEFMIRTESSLAVAEESLLRVTSESPVELMPPPALPRLTDAVRETPRLPQVESISIESKILRQVGPDHSVSISNRILVVEESLFYRHFIRIALETAGYEPVVPETIEEGRKHLDSATNFCAILASAKTAAILSDALNKARHRQGVKTVLLTTASNSESVACEFDDRVSVSHPQRLIAAIERLLGQSPNESRRPA